MTKNSLYLTLGLILGTLSRLAAAQQDEVEEVLVWGRQADLNNDALSASEGLVRYADFSMRPMSRVGDLVEVIPGMIATQHSGSGKANQYFLRGFNLDHGTDFAAFVDGVPANQRSHGHGHGYLDLNFIIPETVEHVSYSKGPYAIDRGDFAIAGSSSIKTYDQFERPFVNLTVGSYKYARISGGASTNVFSGDLLFAGEAQSYNGPWELDEDLQKYSALAKYTKNYDQHRFQIVLNGYHSAWASTDQIPMRAVEEGYLTFTENGLERMFLPRRGNIDPDLGGETTRASAVATLQSGRMNLSAYAIHYDFDLFSNFTYFLADPLRGDQFEQVDNRLSFGGAGEYNFEKSVGELKLENRFGGEFRHDDVGEIGLFPTQRRKRIGVKRNDSVSIDSVAGFVESTVYWMPRLRMTLGTRVDHMNYGVRESFIAENVGRGSDTIVSPKVTLAWSATDDVELYVNYGAGFHSNDVRGAVINIDPNTKRAADKSPPLVRGHGAEIGVRATSLAALNLTAAGFWVDLDSELVFVGDAGGTEPNDSTRRLGVEAEALWRATDWLTLDTSMTWVNGRFSDAPAGRNRIPNAFENTLSAGATWTASNNLSMTVRLRHLGPSPLTEDNSFRSDPTTTVNLRLEKKLGSFKLGLDILNLLDSTDNDISYFYESRLPNEGRRIGSSRWQRLRSAKNSNSDHAGTRTFPHLQPLPTPPPGIEDIHFHPLEPRMVRFTISTYF